MEDKEIALSSSYCWRCGNDNNREELVCLCKCADKLIHVYCLTKIANTVNIFNCPFCNARYPLERRPKSFLKMLRKVNHHFLMILLIILTNSTIGVIMYVMLLKVLELLNVQFSFIIKIIDQVVCLWFICIIENALILWIYEIWEPYHQWYESIYEWKLIRPSTN